MNTTLTQDELNLVLNGLAELPFKLSQPLIARLAKEFNEQSKEVELTVDSE